MSLAAYNHNMVHTKSNNCHSQPYSAGFEVIIRSMSVLNMNEIHEIFWPVEHVIL